MMQQYPIISCMQKIVIYETKARFFVVGSNNTETRFRVLKIDRTEPRELHIVEDKLEYTPRQIRELLYMIDMGNRSKVLQKGSSGLSRRVSTFGLVGFVRFLEGYYIVLITKRRRVALIGSHTVYKIEDTSLVYIPNDTVRYTHPDEPRYVKMFQSMDLSSNFYFSYSYDLTHTLQYNMTPVKHLDTMANVTMSVDPWPPGGSAEGGGDLDDENHVEEASNLTFCAEDEEVNTAGVEQPLDQGATSRCGGTDSDMVYGVRTEPCWKFVWNFHMLKNVCTLLHSDWLLYIIHGFVGQSNIVVFGRPIYLTLIARRSRQFAGTRFLKRGANFEGYVANEVETEQVVHDASVLSLDKARLTAFVQMRGSVPALWSQDISNKMMPKPMINVDQADPFGDVAGKHFDQVLKRYGAPVIILDLVKTKEKKQRERIVREQMIKALQYLNQFLPHEHTIRYIGFDMAKVTKSKNTNVLLRLAKIAEYCVKKTGFFHTGPHRVGGSEGVSGAPPGQGVGQKQHGVVRTNCVDCLDRTNTAQFAVGKCALAFQLHNLGVLDTPCLEFDTDCVRMLEDLYEDHGDILALQYGGSQLVHRIKSYRKVAPWTSSSRDIMHTLSRYYSNTFSDADRQHSMNLFLGTFTPKEGQLNIWELPTDFYLHNPCTLFGPTPRTRSYTQWWQTEVINCLPLSYEEESKGTQGETVVIRTNRLDERLDGYWEYYHPYLLTTLEELFSFHMNNSIRDFMPKCVNSYSPFVLRVRPGRRQEESGTTEANPNVSGKDSSSSLTSVGSDGSTSSSSDIEGDFTELEDNALAEDDSKHNLVSLKDMFSTMEQIYGVNIHEPSQYSGVVYRRFIQIGENATKTLKKTERCAQAERRTTNLVQMSTFPLDSCYHVVPPKVSTRSRDLYNTYVKRGIHGAEFPGKCDMRLYHEYVLSNYK